MMGQPSSLTIPNDNNSKQKILKLLALYEVLTSRDLASLIHGNTSHSHITTINKTLSILDDRHHLVNRIYFRPEKYSGRGNLPNAAGLSEDGVTYANEHWPETYPKEFPATHSPHTIEHDLRRARTHIEIAKLADRKGWQIGWQKGDAHLLKPDDVFEITATKTAHFFLEEEYKRKDFDKLYKKFKPYVDLHGSGKMKDEWNFRHYTVIVPMRDKDAMTNALIHFIGECNCVDRRFKKMHQNAPFRLMSDVLAFTTHDALMGKTNEKIFFTPTGKQLSFLDIVR